MEGAWIKVPLDINKELCVPGRIIRICQYKIAYFAFENRLTTLLDPQWKFSPENVIWVQRSVFDSVLTGEWPSETGHDGWLDEREQWKIPTVRQVDPFGGSVGYLVDYDCVDGYLVESRRRVPVAETEGYEDDTSGGIVTHLEILFGLRQRADMEMIRQSYANPSDPRPRSDAEWNRSALAYGAGPRVDDRTAHDALYDNDVAADARGNIVRSLEDGLSITQALVKLVGDFSDYFADSDQMAILALVLGDYADGKLLRELGLYDEVLAALRQARGVALISLPGTAAFGSLKRLNDELIRKLITM